MNFQHLILAGLWIFYCFIHSFSAAIPVKKAIARLMGKSYKYYRLIYSIFAFFTLVIILWYQFSLPGIILFSSRYNLISGLVLAFPGLCIMIICINKYFYELSGVQVLEKQKPKATLQQGGLHKYVRHPLYLGTLLFIWGLFLIFPFLANLIACFIIHIYILLGIKLEEKKLFLEYGEVYREYSAKAGKLIPWLNKVKMY